PLLGVVLDNEHNGAPEVRVAEHRSRGEQLPGAGFLLHVSMMLHQARRLPAGRDQALEADGTKGVRTACLTALLAPWRPADRAAAARRTAQAGAPAAGSCHRLRSAGMLRAAGRSSHRSGRWPSRRPPPASGLPGPLASPSRLAALSPGRR